MPHTNDITLNTIELTYPRDGVVVATLRGSGRGNAMTTQMFDDLEQLARRLDIDTDERVLIMTGAGTMFCAGYDLDDADSLAALSPMETLALQERAARSLGAIRSMNIPVIAAVNGAAAGGGLALALVADIRLASTSAKFNAAFVRIGLSAGDLGTSWLLPRLVGPARANEIAFTGRFVLADEAERIGLVNAVTEPETLMSEAITMAEAIAANSPGAVAMSKRALRANMEISSFAAALELENRGQALLTCGSDMPEALAAFKERRPPHFTGG